MSSSHTTRSAFTLHLGLVGLLLAAAVPGWSLANAVDATPAGAAKSDGRCDLCGSCVCVRKVCVAKPKEKEITKTCWSYKCEDFCIPGRSEYCGKVYGKDECGCWSHDEWKPTCAEVRTKRVPVKTEVKRKVPSVEWTVEERCAACRGGRCDPSCNAAP